MGVAGCEDDEADENGGVTTSSLSKTAYVKQANEICTEVDKRIATKVKPIYNDGGFTAKSYSKSMETVFIPESEAQVESAGGARRS